MKRKKLAIVIVAIFLIVSITIVINKGIHDLSSTDEIGNDLGILTLFPTLLAVLLAFITNNVLISLLLGFLLGAILLGIIDGINSNIFVGIINQTGTSLKNVLFDMENINILILCLTVGGMIEIVRSSGGFEALAIKLTKKINSPRKSQLIASLLGCIIFFDDYANSLIVGPVMKPITDRVKVSREKLAYIVDSTAAPVTGIALISSWVAVEISAIEKGLQTVDPLRSGFSVFLNSIPYTFYCLFCLTFIFLNGLTNRDFGPMLKAEIRARNGQTVSDESKKNEKQSNINVNDKYRERIFTGVGGIILLIVFAMVAFYVQGRSAAINAGALMYNSPFNIPNIITAISYADTISLVTISSLVGSIFAIIFGCIFKLFNFKDSIKYWFKGAKSLLSTVIMLALAWCLADTISRLGATSYVVGLVNDAIPPIIIPIFLFIICCIISFASGSYGCLFVVMPLAIPLAYKVIAINSITNPEIFLALCSGSVMAGSIFGDHCSPVTDCTILSAIGSGCTTIEHCKTQLPYAFVCAIVSIVCGIALTYLGLNVFISLGIGILVQILILYVFGKEPNKEGK